MVGIWKQQSPPFFVGQGFIKEELSDTKTRKIKNEKQIPKYTWFVP